MINTNEMLADLVSALSGALEVLNTHAANLYAEANEQRDEMRNLISRMDITRSRMYKVSDVLYETKDHLEAIADQLDETGGVISDIMECPTDCLPDAPLQNFVGFCEECGAEILRDDPYITPSDKLLCEHCQVEDDNSDWTEEPEIVDEETEDPKTMYAAAQMEMDVNALNA
jgi:hypothetical protein